MTWTPLHEIFAWGNRWFDELPARLRKEVLSKSRRRSYARGETLHRRGDPANAIYCVAQGCVQAAGISGSGKLTILDFYGPGVWFGETPVLAGMPRGHDIAAYEPSDILHLAAEDAEALMKVHPEFARGLLSLESRRLVMLLVALETYSAHSMEQRLANRLLLLASTFGRPQPDGSGTLIELRLPQHILAELIGTTRPRVNQILLAWDRDGIVRHRDARVLLRNPAALSRLIAE